MIAAVGVHLQAEIALNKKEGNITRRESLLQAYKQTGKWYEELNTPPIPIEIAQEWLWFADLSSRRPSGFSGVCSIPFSEYLAWMEYTGVNPNKLQRQLLADTDLVLVNLLNEDIEKHSK